MDELNQEILAIFYHYFLNSLNPTNAASEKNALLQCDYKVCLFGDQKRCTSLVEENSRP